MKISKGDYKSILGKNVAVNIDRKLGSRQKLYKKTLYTINFGYIDGYTSPDNKPQDAYILGAPQSSERFTGVVIGVIIRKNDSTDKWVVAPKDVIFCEPQIRDAVLFQEQHFEAEYKCYYEKSCGSIVYTMENGVRKFLLIKSVNTGHIGFPKGHVEFGESEKETAMREVFEETGLRIEPENDFRSEYKYFLRNGVSKNCVYFTSEYSGQGLNILKSELENSWLLPYDEAIKLLNYAQDKIVLMEAMDYYEKKGNCSGGLQTS